MICFSNPKVKSYPDELATMKRLYEVELDDSHAAALAVNPNLVSSQSAKVHYSRVRSIIREKYYNVDYHSGVKMTVIGDNVGDTLFIYLFMADFSLVF